VANNLLDLTALLEVGEGLAGKAAVDLETVDEGGNGDQTVGLNILVELLGSGLLEDDGVLGLVLDYIETQVSTRFCPFSNSVRPIAQTIPFRFSFFREMSDESSKVGSRWFTVAWLVMMIAYPCPWTTSSFAFLRAPVTYPC